MRPLTRMLLILTAFMCQGCVKWVALAASPETPLTHQLSAARVITHDGKETIMADVAIGSDSVTGFLDERRRQRYSIPLSNVSSIERRTTSVTRTAVAVVGFAGAFTLAYFVIGLATLGPGY